MTKKTFAYRVWDTQDKKFLMQRHSGLSFYDRDFGDDVGVFEDVGFFMNKDRYVVQEFIGLQDQTGANIYGGDIVRLMQHGDNDKPPLYAEIKWSANGCYLFSRPYNHNRETIAKVANRGYAQTWTVVGNIFETPELLK